MKKLAKTLLTLVSTVAVLVGVVSPTPAHAKPLYPSAPLDPFFRAAPQDYKKKPKGHIIRERTFPHPLAAGGLVTQFLFSTRNSFNKPVYATATLIRPLTFRPNGKVIVINDFINSLGVGCQPTYSYSAVHPEWNSRSALTMMYATIAAHFGFAVLLPDHEGMNASYTANKLAGHISLDALRAVKTHPKFKMQKSWSAMAGYSGGGMVTLWASILQPKYAPKLHVNAYAAGGIPTDLTYYSKLLGNKPNPAFGLAYASMIGLEREYGSKRVNVYSRLTAHGREKALQNRDACSPRLLHLFNGESVPRMFRNVNFTPEHEKKAFQVLRENSLLFDKRTPRKGTKMFIFNSKNDIGAPTRRLRKVMRRYCKAGTKIQYMQLDDPDHVRVALMHIPDAAQWIGHMSNGGKIRNDCSRLTR